MQHAALATTGREHGGSDKTRRHGAWAPLLAVAAVFAVVALLGFVVDLDSAQVPKPDFRALAIRGYPKQTALPDAALIVDAAMWWLCLSVVLWVAGLFAVLLSWLQLHHATRHDPPLARSAKSRFLLVVAVAAGALVFLAVVRKAPLMSFSVLVENLDMMSRGFVRLSLANTGLAVVVCAALLGALSLLLLPGTHEDRTMKRMHALTNVMYAGAAFLLVWISAATAMYHLSALLLVPEARVPALKLAPTISLMGGLFLSLLLGAAYLAAVAWLQLCHDRSAEAAPADSPRSFLAAHWPKVIAILMPLLPGAAESVLQVLTQVP